MKQKKITRCPFCGRRFTIPLPVHWSMVRECGDQAEITSEVAGTILTSEDKQGKQTDGKQDGTRQHNLF